MPLPWHWVYFLVYPELKLGANWGGVAAATKNDFGCDVPGEATYSPAHQEQFLMSAKPGLFFLLYRR